MGYSRWDPAPKGYPLEKDLVECTLLDAERGISLGEWEWPKEDTEPILVTVRLRNIGPPSQTRHYSSDHFRVVGSRGIRGTKMFILFDLEGDLGFGDLAGGSEVTGKIVREVGIGETGLVLIWDAGSGVPARYFSLEE